MIDNAPYDPLNTFIVTGSKTNADITLTLHIPYSEDWIVWQATYQSSSTFSATNLLSLSGGGMGTFEVLNGTLITANANTIHGAYMDIIVSGTGKVQTFGDGVHAIITNGNVEIKDNAQVSGTTGEVIRSEGNNAIITVSGGSVTATSENAILVHGTRAHIIVTGGYVGNNAVGFYPVIYVKENESFISVSGTSKVEARGEVPAIEIDKNTSMEVSGNAHVIAFKNRAIACSNGGRVIVSENSIVETKENDPAIYMRGYGEIVITDRAQVIAAHGYAVVGTPNYPALLNLTGGLAFAYGNKKADVLYNLNSIAPTDSGVVLAWNKAEGNTIYELYSSDDIFKLPETATAYWDKKEAKSGISYANGENT